MERKNCQNVKNGLAERERERGRIFEAFVNIRSRFNTASLGEGQDTLDTIALASVDHCHPK